MLLFGICFIAAGVALIGSVVGFWFYFASQLGAALDDRSPEGDWDVHHDPMWG